MRPPLPTGLGVKALLFYGVLGGAFLAAPYSNLYFLLLAFLTVLGVLGYFWTWRNLAGVTGRIPDIEPHPAGAPVPWRVEVRAGRRARFGLRARMVLSGHGPVYAAAQVLEGSSAIRGALPPLPRGVYRVERADLGSNSPLGLFGVRRGIPGPDAVVVYPSPAAAPELRRGAAGLADLLGNGFSGEGFLQPSSLREYRPGDDPRRIHHKASARRGAFVIKEFEGGAGNGIEVVLDRRTDPASLEHALSLLAAVALAAREGKEVVELKSQGFAGTFGPGHRPFRELLTFLAAAEPLPAGGPAPPPASPAVPRLPARRPAGGRP